MFPQLKPCTVADYAPTHQGGVPLVIYDNADPSNPLPTTIFSPLSTPKAQHAAYDGSHAASPHTHGSDASRGSRVLNEDSTSSYDGAFGFAAPKPPPGLLFRGPIVMRASGSATTKIMVAVVCGS